MDDLPAALLNIPSFETQNDPEILGRLDTSGSVRILVSRHLRAEESKSQGGGKGGSAHLLLDPQRL